MPRTVAQKMGVKPGSRTFFMNAPEAVHETIDLPDLVVGERLDGEFDYMHLFVITQAEMNDQFPRLKAHLRAGGMLWLSWPKGRKLGSDLTLPKVIEIGYNHGLVESTCLSVDPTWSGLKFTHPKRGKTYHNSYGTLPGQ
ncbi:hypothetical protein [Micromonospora sp. NBC_01739]|uniref:hypothetical protein n=1 Tax=Micromonospora sp. NBC_01739 TaxID=2975985 RepID=UPI002E0D7221|nr:hypothetical protein OIE53_19110 [Micromonospora sp. NBC_01739]